MIPAEIDKILNKHQLELHEFEEASTPTAATAAEKLGCVVGQIAKSLLFKLKSGEYVLIVCAGDARVSSKKVRAYFGMKARMAKAEELMEILGYKPGEVGPFAITQVPVYLDESLKHYSLVYPAAGTDSSGVAVSWDQLCSITAGTPCDLTDAPVPSGRGPEG